MSRPVILVGLSGSGKSTIGRRLAAMSALRFKQFVDLDEAIEREAGRSTTDLFARSGEAAFRRLERAAMDRALTDPAVLIAAGAGWMAEPGNLAAARSRRALVIYLQVSPATAAARLRDDRTRPLLEGGDRATRLDELLRAREGSYRQADIAIDAEADLETVAARVTEALLGER